MLDPVCRKRLLDQRLEVGAAPVRVEQKTVRTGQRLQTADERLAERLDRLGRAIGLQRQRLYDRQRIVDTMTELLCQQLALRLRALAVVDVDAVFDDRAVAQVRP